MYIVGVNVSTFEKVCPQFLNICYPTHKSVIFTQECITTQGNSFEGSLCYFLYQLPSTFSSPPLFSSLISPFIYLSAISSSIRLFQGTYNLFNYFPY